MKNLLVISVVGAALCSAPAFAAAPAAINWTGCYAGGNVGYGRQYNHPFDNVAPGSVQDGTGQGAVGGAQVGCDYRFANSWLVGAQGMFDGAGIDDNHALLSGGGTEKLGFNTEWLATLTGRVGATVLPQVLLYAKGGLAMVHINYSDADATAPYAYEADALRRGWIAGGGAEYAFQPNWSVLLEYNYIDFGSRNITTNKTLGSGGFPALYSYRESHNLQTILIGLNYHFISF